MKISFARQGVEECEDCDEFRIHKAEFKKAQGTRDEQTESDDDAEQITRIKLKSYQDREEEFQM